jgi:hypothetical protein
LNRLEKQDVSAAVLEEVERIAPKLVQATALHELARGGSAALSRPSKPLTVGAPDIVTAIAGQPVHSGEAHSMLGHAFALRIRCWC